MRDVQRALAPIREREAMRLLKEHGMKINQRDRTPFLKFAKEMQNKLAQQVGAVNRLQKIRDAE